MSALVNGCPLMIRRLLVIALIGFWAGNAFAAPPNQTVLPPSGQAAPANPDWVLGNEACVKCHAPEIKVWKQTPHSLTYDELHRRPEAKEIIAKLGIRSVKHEGRCVACHYSQQTVGNEHHVISGVSCESCHGASRNWIDLHHDYGPGQTRWTESPQHRKDRLVRSIAAGMRNPMNVYAVAQSCLRCHTTADEELVNVGGHSAGSLDFEFVSWSQGTIRHNFIASGGKENQISRPDRIRVMFVAGMIAELEASLRATSLATQKATYGITSAKRGARALARLTSVANKVDSVPLNRVVEIGKSVKFKLNNRAQLQAAADQIALLGHEFAEVTDGRTLAALDKFVPKTAK